ncbi:MAG: hypothetical protein ACEQSF_00145, partial [Solirubrobacteraceae bacterium]
DVSYNEHNFRIKNPIDKLIHAFRKLFFNDYEYKTQLKIKNAKTEILNKIESIETKVDYALIVRSDIYPIDIIKKIKDKSKKTIGYQWDGLHRFPVIYKHIAYYDKFYVFDEKDKNTQNVSLLNNFYFDYDAKQDDAIYQDFFFVGTYIKERMSKIESLLTVLDDLQMTYKVILLSNQSIKCNNSKIEITNKPLAYDDYLAYLKSSTICLDFLNNTHNGLSFRTFEALCFDKKLVTNNKNVKKYDFYHPNNIFILEKDNYNKLKDFLQKPYVKIEEKIKLKYGFKNWIEIVLNS